MMTSAGILDNEDRILFARFCEYIEASKSPMIDMEEIILDIIKWAERHNYGPMRLTQTVKRMIGQCVNTLSKRHFCKINSSDGEEINSFEMIEPEVEVIRTIYNRMDKDIEQGFPTEKDLPLPLAPQLFISADDSQIGVNLLEKSVKEQKIVKLYFNELDREILLEPKMFPQIVNICIKRIKKFLSSTGRVRILDDVAKNLEMVMPGKTVNADRIIRILDLEEKESPIFFVHLAESLINRIGDDRGRSDLMSIYLASIILKRFKMEQETREEGKRKEELQVEDAKKLLSHMHKNPKTFTKAEMLRFREGEAMKERLEGSYDKTEFAELVEFFIHTYALPADDNTDASLENQVPMIILFHAEGKDLYIHREFVVSLLERERTRAAHDIENELRSRWSNALRNYEKLPEMNNDAILEDSIRKMVAQEFSLLFNILSLREELFHIFQIYKNEPGISSHFSFYFPKSSKSEMRSLTELMGIKRQNLYRESYNALPYIYRFPLTRLILFIISLFKKKKPVEEEAKESGEGDEEDFSSKAAEEAIQRRKELSGKLRRYLPDIEKKYRAGGSVQTTLRDLQERWNIKIGDVREILNEKVDRDIAEKALAIYKICLKSPHLSEEFLHQELKNMATNLVMHKYTDIHDKKSLARYIMIRAIWVLHQKTRLS